MGDGNESLPKIGVIYQGGTIHESISECRAGFFRLPALKAVPREVAHDMGAVSLRRKETLKSEAGKGSTLL